MKRRILALVTAFVMVVTMLPASAFAEGEKVAEVNGVEYATLADAVNAVPDNTETTIKMLKDYAVPAPIEIDKNKNIVFDMNDKKITAGSGFTTRLFTNYGVLKIQGNGTVDVTAAGKDGADGYGTVNNYGTLTVVDGKYINTKESDASNFYNRSGGTAVFINPIVNGGGGCINTAVNTETEIRGGSYSNETYPAIENRGNMLITAGEFTNTSCSSCDGRWGYTIRSGESSDTAYLKIQGKDNNSVKVTGVQGGLSVVGGTADVYNGTYKTVQCTKNPAHTASFYAGYFTGESYETSTTIYGGYFESCSKTGILVGNGNPAPDSGEGKESTVDIKGGTFIGGDENKTAITVNKTEYAIGAASVSGGEFSSSPSEFVKKDSTFVKSATRWYSGREAENAISSAVPGSTLEILQYSNNIVVPEGVNIKNSTGHSITVNGETVNDGGNITAPAIPDPPVIVYPVISRIAAIADQEYTGSAIEPAITVYDQDGDIITPNNYIVSYTNNIEPGTATVTVTGKAGVLGSATATFTIVKKEDPQPPQTEKPGKVEITKTSSDFGRIRVYFDKVAAVGDNTMRYQIQSQKVGSDVVKTQYATAGYSYATVRDLAYNAKYNIRIRAYYVDENGERIYGDWSEIKSVYANRIGTSNQVMYKAGITKLTAGKTSVAVDLKKVAFTKNPVKITYQIAYKKKGATKFSYAYTTNLKKTVYNLSKNTNYQFKVRYYYKSLVDDKLVFSPYTALKTVKTAR